MLLITVAGMKQNAWFLLAIGCIGMVQNIYAAGARRYPGAYGIHLDFQETIVGQKVMGTLMTCEDNYPGLGYSLLDTYFPGMKLRKGEEEYWTRIASHLKELDHNFGLHLQRSQDTLTPPPSYHKANEDP